MTAVAVWDRRPTAEDLLERRLARGWRPTATALRGGARVLGYAAGARRGEPRAGEMVFLPRGV